jgi:biopolymer transport protein ExbD
MRSKSLSILSVVITLSFFFATATMMAKDITSDIPKGKSLPAPYSSTKQITVMDVGKFNANL